MPLVEGGVAYLTATEASKELGLSRQMFYQSIKPMLRAHRVSSRKHVYYREDDVKSLKNVQRVENLPIAVQGISRNFEKEMRSQGYDVSVETLAGPAIVQMNEQVAAAFNKPVGSPVVMRKRRQGVRGVPYRVVVNYYPIELAGESIIDAMRQDDEADVLDLIKHQHNVIIQQVHELVKARLPNVEERRLLGIRAHDPIMEVKRTNYTDDKKTVVMFNELVLVAGYFELSYDYETKAFAG